MYYPGCGERCTTLWGWSAGAAQSTVARTGLMQSCAVRALSYGCCPGNRHCVFPYRMLQFPGLLCGMAKTTCGSSEPEMGETCEYCTPVTLLLQLLSHSPLFEVLQEPCDSHVCSSSYCILHPGCHVSSLYLKDSPGDWLRQTLGCNSETITMSAAWGDAANDDTPRGRGWGGARCPQQRGGGGAARTPLQPAYPPAQNLAKQTLCPGPILSQRNMCCSGPVNVRLCRVTVQPQFSTITSSF